MIKSGLVLKESDVSSEFEQLINKLTLAGLECVSIVHSGSAMGLSKYFDVIDPITGIQTKHQFRVSAHFKGPLMQKTVIDVNLGSAESIIDMFHSQRTEAFLHNKMISDAQKEAIAINRRIDSARKKIKKGKSLTISETEAISYVKS